MPRTTSEGVASDKDQSVAPPVRRSPRLNPEHVSALTDSSSNTDTVTLVSDTNEDFFDAEQQIPPMMSFPLMGTAFAGAQPVKLNSSQHAHLASELTRLETTVFPLAGLTTDLQRVTFALACCDKTAFDTMTTVMQSDTSLSQDKISWIKFKEILLSKFRPADFSWTQQEKLFTFSQGPKNTLESYILAFKAIASTIPHEELAERTRIMFFLAGLSNENLRNHVRRKCPNTLEETIDHARAFSRAPPAPSHTHKKPFTPHKPQPPAQLHATFQTPTPDNPHYCTFCKKYRNHTSEKCRSNPANKQPTPSAEPSIGLRTTPPSGNGSRRQ